MKIQAPTVGPIIGYTSSNHVRIWLRGDFQTAPDGYRRAFGAVRIKGPGDPKFRIKFSKLPPYFDMTGVCVFEGLQPETEYEYQAGWFFAETSLENLDDTQLLDWSLGFSGKFRTGSALATRSRSYAVGSCRYLLRLFGGLIFDERGDKVFDSISRQIQSGAPLDGLIMTGDQIYADDINVLGQDRTIDQFLARYRSVFSQRFLRALMSRVPTYMILDDHEIEDNWPSKADSDDWVNLYPNAIHAYQIYQCSHSPLFELEGGRIDGTLDRFWYTFRDGCCDWFVMDSRNERVWDEDHPEKRRMISRTQMDGLKAWLGDGSGAAKLVVTSVPFFPDLDEENDDKWGGYAAERTEILDFVLTKKIRKVVFISGDVHCSFSAELRSSADPAFKIISVISSSFFWPYPHMGAGDFALTASLQGAPKGKFKVGAASEVHSTDNFARLTVTPNDIEISFYERKGAKLSTTKRTF